MIKVEKSLSYLINKRQIRSDWNGEVGGQTVHLTENLISMNLLQMSCVITWAQKKLASNLKKKIKRTFFWKKKFQIGISTSKFLIWEKKFSFSPQKCKLELCMSNGSEVLIYLSFLLKEAVIKLQLQLQTNIWLLFIFIYQNEKLSFTNFVLI